MMVRIKIKNNLIHFNDDMVGDIFRREHVICNLKIQRLLKTLKHREYPKNIKERLLKSLNTENILKTLKH